MFIGFSQRLGFIELEERTAVPFLQEVQAQDGQMGIEGVGVELQHSIHFLVRFIAALQFHICKEVIEIRLALISVQGDGLVQGFDGVFVIPILEFHFTQQQISPAILRLMFDIDFQDLDGLFVPAGLGIQLTQQKVGRQVCHIQLVGFFRRLDGLLGIAFLQAGQRQGVINQG